MYHLCICICYSYFIVRHCHILLLPSMWYVCRVGRLHCGMQLPMAICPFWDSWLTSMAAAPVWRRAVMYVCCTVTWFMCLAQCFIHNGDNTMMLWRLIVVLIYIVAKFTDEQYTTINQSTAGHFDPRVFINCLQMTSTCKLLKKTLGSKCLAVDWLIVVHCSSVNFATVIILCCIL